MCIVVFVPNRAREYFKSWWRVHVFASGVWVESVQEEGSGAGDEGKREVVPTRDKPK